MIDYEEVIGVIDNYSVDGEITFDEVEGVTEGISFLNEADPTVPDCVKHISSTDIESWDHIKDMSEITNLEIDAIFK